MSRAVKVWLVGQCQVLGWRLCTRDNTSWGSPDVSAELDAPDAMMPGVLPVAASTCIDRSIIFRLQCHILCAELQQDGSHRGSTYLQVLSIRQSGEN